MRKTAATALFAITLASAQVAIAQRRPPTEAEALTYVYSAFLTQADPGVMANPVLIGPELQRAFAMPASAEGGKVYEAIIARIGTGTMDVRKATPQELAAYGSRRGLNPRSGPLYALDAGQQHYLVQYDLQRMNIAFVGQLGVPNPDPRRAELDTESEPTKGGPASAGLTTVAMRDSRAQSAPLRLEWTGLFALNSAELSAGARVALDAEVVPKLAKAGEIRVVSVSGHADRLGSAEYNQKLSELRAAAVRDYLVSRGVDEARIEVYSFGKTAPVKACPAEHGAALLECLAPNRRVVLEITAQ